MVNVVRTAEHTGYEAVFVPEIAAREAFSTLTGLASVTSRMRLGTGVITIQSRTPALAAMAAGTLHDVSGGRCVVGIGAGSGTSAAGLREAPATGGGPVALVGEYVRVVREALAGRPVDSAAYGLSGFRLGVEFAGRPPEVWVAALGDRMVSLAGGHADGVLLNWCTPERVAEARGTLADAAERAGRNPSSIAVGVYVRASLDADGAPGKGETPAADEARTPEALRAMAGLYASFPAYARQFARMGFEAEAAAAVSAQRDGHLKDVPDAFVRAFIVTGGRAEALARFDAYHQAGADLVLCYPVAAGADPQASVLRTAAAAAPSPAA